VGAYSVRKWLTVVPHTPPQEANAAAAKQAAEAAVAELRAEAATLRAEAAASAEARRDAETARGAQAAAEARAQALEVQLSPLGAAGPPPSPPAIVLATQQVFYCIGTCRYIKLHQVSSMFFIRFIS